MHLAQILAILKKYGYPFSVKIEATKKGNITSMGKAIIT